MYKDKDKQRQAIREATRRYRAKNKVSALSSQKQGLENARGCTRTDEGGNTPAVIPSNVIPSNTQDVIPQSHNPMMVGYVPPQETD